MLLQRAKKICANKTMYHKISRDAFTKHLQIEVERLELYESSWNGPIREEMEFWYVMLSDSLIAWFWTEVLSSGLQTLSWSHLWREYFRKLNDQPGRKYLKIVTEKSCSFLWYHNLWEDSRLRFVRIIGRMDTRFYSKALCRIAVPIHICNCPWVRSR